MKNNEMIRGILTNESNGILRLIYSNGEILYFGRDVAIGMGFSDPRKAVSACCVRIYRELHETPSGEQFLNFINYRDVVRLYQHSRADKAGDFLISLKAAKDAFMEKVNEMLEQEGTSDDECLRIEEYDTETGNAIERFVSVVEELHEKYGIFVSIEGVYIDDGGERSKIC